jgi:hypothetical protein
MGASSVGLDGTTPATTPTTPATTPTASTSPSSGAPSAVTAAYEVVRRGVWCEDGALTDNYNNLSAAHCEAECNAMTSCNLVLFGYDSGANTTRCTTFSTCNRYHPYEDGNPTLSVKPHANGIPTFS